MKALIGHLTLLAVAVVLSQCAAPPAGRPYDEKMEHTHIMYQKLTCNLMVEDVHEAIRFYRDMLEFAFVIAVPKDSQTVITELDPARPLAFAIMQHGDVQVMLQSRASLTADLPFPADQPVGGSVVLYIETSDVRSLYEKLRGKVKILRDLHDTFYGKQEFYIEDCNGYVLGFAGNPPPEEGDRIKPNS